MKENLSDEGRARRDFLRRAVEVGAGAVLASGGMTEEAMARKAKPNAMPIMPRITPGPESGMSESAVRFVDFLRAAFAKAGNSAPDYLPDALLSAQEKYLNDFCQEAGVDPVLRTSAIDSHAIFTAFVRATQIKDIDPRISTALYLSANDKLRQSAQESLTGPPQRGGQMPHIDPNNLTA